MCEGLAAMRKAMGVCAAGFDASLISATVASQVVEDASAIEKMAAAMKAQAAARVAETGLWKGEGDRSAAHHLARKTGTSVGQAADAIETARRLAELPATKKAASRGELSPQQASAIAAAATADPGAEKRLLEQAKTGSLGELREEAARTKAAAEPDPEAKRKRIHDGRYLREYADAEGAWNLRMRDNPEVGAEMMAHLGPEIDRLFKKARAEGRREPREAYAADALAAAVCREQTATAGKPGPSAHKIIARVDLAALLRGYPTEAEVCELLGYGPVACSAVRDMVAAGGFLALVVTKGKEVLGVAHLGRRPTAHQQSALEWLYPTCAVRGCNAAARIENDHRLDWAESHFTLLDLVDRLCHHHHRLKTLEGWALVEGTGKRDFVPPDDPRHPRNAHAPPPRAAA